MLTFKILRLKRRYDGSPGYCLVTDGCIDCNGIQTGLSGSGRPDQEETQKYPKWCAGGLALLVLVVSTPGGLAAGLTNLQALWPIASRSMTAICGGADLKWANDITGDKAAIVRARLASSTASCSIVPGGVARQSGRPYEPSKITWAAFVCISNATR